jgi:hypothetical protein
MACVACVAFEACALAHAVRTFFVVRGLVRDGLKSVPAKVRVSLRVDQNVLEWFKAQGSGDQPRINAVLRAFREASTRAGSRTENRYATAQKRRPCAEQTARASSWTMTETMGPLAHDIFLER